MQRHNESRNGSSKHYIKVQQSLDIDSPFIAGLISKKFLFAVNSSVGSLLFC